MYKASTDKVYIAEVACAHAQACTVSGAVSTKCSKHIRICMRIHIHIQQPSRELWQVGQANSSSFTYKMMSVWSVRIRHFLDGTMASSRKLAGILMAQWHLRFSIWLSNLQSRDEVRQSTATKPVHMVQMAHRDGRAQCLKYAMRDFSKFSKTQNTFLH